METTLIRIGKIATSKDIEVEISDVVQSSNLAVARLYADDSFGDEVVLLDKAMKTEQETGKFSVTETDEVQSLRIINGLDERVFIAGGSVIEGDSQNRMVLYPTMIPARAGVN